MAEQLPPAEPAEGQVNPDSVWQVEEHPSPLIVLPSSQVSGLSTITSPQRGPQTEGCPVQVNPD